MIQAGLEPQPDAAFSEPDDAYPEILSQAISTASWNIYMVNDLHDTTTY